MQFRWCAITIAAALLAAGCQNDKPKKPNPTQKELVTHQWNAARASVLASLATDQYHNGNFDKCRSTVNDALTLDPKNVGIHILSAKLAIEQGQLEAAEQDLSIARQLNPDADEALYLSGVICQRWQKPAEALRYYTAASEKAPTELSYVLARAEMLVAADRQAEALSLLQEKVVYFEHSAVIRDAVGQLLVQGHQYSQAADMLRQASILANDDQTIKEHLSLALYYAGQYSEAMEIMSRLTKEEPYSKRADLMTALAECQFHTGHDRDARASFETAAQLDAGSPGVWLDLAKVAMQMHDTERADRSLRKAIALNAESSEANLLLGYIRLRQDRLDESLLAFRKASAIDPRDVVARCMVGYVLEKKGQKDAATQCYGQALQLKPNDELASKLMASVDLAQ